LLFLAYNGPTKKKHITFQIRPAIDKPTVYKALKQLNEDGYITFKKKERGSDRGVKSEISQEGLLELLRFHSRGPTASTLRTKMFDLINKSPALRADPEWIVTVQSLIPLIKKINTRILPSRASNVEIDEEYILEMIWQDPRKALGKLISLIEFTCLTESSYDQARAPDEAFRELQTIFQKRPMYAKLAVEVVKTEIERYDRMIRVKKAMEDFVTANP